MIEDAVGEMVGATRLAQNGDRRIEPGGSIGIAGDARQAGPCEAPFGAQEQRDMPDGVSVQEHEEFVHGVGVTEVGRRAGGQRPRPTEDGVAYPDRGA